AFTGSGKIISVNDVDGNLASTKLTVLHGTLHIGNLNGATISAGANDSGTLTLSGTQTQINAALGTLSYQGVLNYNGADTLTVVSTDSAGSSDTDTVALTVNAVNDAPVNAVPGAQAVSTNTNLVFSGANAISISDVDAGAATETVKLTVTHGT